VACPMCHVNLDLKQADVARAHGVRHDLPVYYLSDLVGLALGLTEPQLGIDTHFVTAPPARTASSSSTPPCATASSPPAPR
jgi:heterodisulfide reductase subunit B